MDEIRVSPEVQEALHELSQYLSDTLPPLMVADGIRVLSAQPPTLVAEQIRAWAAAQYQGRVGGLPVSDYVFHALKKIHLLAELRLVPTDATQRFIAALLPIVEGFCPDEDRALLRGNVLRLGVAESALVSPVETIYRQIGSERPLASRGRAEPTLAGSPTGAVAASEPGTPSTAAAIPASPPWSEETARGLARLGLLAERIERSAGQAGGQPPPEAIAAQLLATAATASRTSRELEENLARIARLGVEVPGTGALFRRLSESLPDWGVPVNPDADETVGPAARGSVVGAMRRIVTLSGDPAEGARRFQEMVGTAIEQLNAGNLGRAVTMFGLAEQIIRKERVEKAVAQSIRARAHEQVDTAAVRSLADRPENHAGLRSVLEFFPALRPDGLLEALREERRRDARRYFLALLEVHGAPAREAALERLATELRETGGGQDWYFLRNLLYVLRRVPRQEAVPSEVELDLLFRLSEPSRPAPLVKEALANLGQTRHERAEQVLVARLSQLESALGKAGGVARDDIHQLLDRTCASLARQATPAALRAVAEHGLSTAGGAGPALSRLSHLASHDLSTQEGVVERLVKALRASLPVRILGLVVSSSTDGDARSLIQALSGTPAPSVLRLLEEIAKKYPDRELGRQARAALGAAEAPRRPAEAPGTANLEGDLGVFGLPTLLQTFEQTQATGVLSLRGGKGETIGSITLEGGAVRGASAGGLLGLPAFYQLLERPSAATFRFTRREMLGTGEDSLGALQPVMALLLEGMRRYDELERARALVPDDARFRPTTVRPTRHPLEDDTALLSTLWAKAVEGATAAECDEAASVDAFRTRRALAHWVEEGALAAVPR